MKKIKTILLYLYIFVTFMSGIIITLLDKNNMWISILILLQFVGYLIIYQLSQKKYKYFIHLSIVLLIAIIILLIKFKPSLMWSIITINGKGKYSFKLSRRFSICYNIATLTATAIPDQLFTGSAVTPDVVIMNGAYRLEKGKDYTLTYMNNTAIGTGIVTITGTAKYAGVKVQSFNILVPQVTNLVKKGNVKTSITLTWDKIDGVTGYRVYRYNPATKKYAFLKQVAGSTNNTYTDKSLTAGTQYRYRVRAYVKVNNVNSYGKYSAKYKTYTKFKKAALKTKAGKKKATLSWKKITGVTGYRVYMKNRKGKYAKIKELKGAGKIKYTKTGLKRGKTYYFRVRAFKTVNGSNIYGAYSTIKTVIAK